MPDFTVPPGWEGPIESGKVMYLKHCRQGRDLGLEFTVAFGKVTDQCSWLSIADERDEMVIPMKSIQDAFNVAEAISAGLWTEADNA